MNIKIQYYSSPIGELILGDYDNKICLCDWVHRKKRNEIDNRIQKFINAKYSEDDSEIIKNTIKQLNEYFEKKRTSFSIPLLLCGSDFQQMVWKELLKTSYGTTYSYFQLSQKLKNEKAIRAIASANGANAISIIIPCHRIIGNNRELVGYAGGLSAKKYLLDLEASIIQTSLF